MTTRRERALFEAGIKLGALYHQFSGSPISLQTRTTMERAIEESISLQPFVEDIVVRVDESRIKEDLNAFGYCELTGDMLEVELTVNVEGEVVKVAMSVDESGYPLMRVLE
ncbi:MAG: dihydroneopterin aldolase family protein [Methermicoccaceae archaeon]